jgi:2-polyprenyl-3-methyl-5-hydroxy-6-metoxy-1,4-benzoquinol methylase
MFDYFSKWFARRDDTDSSRQHQIALQYWKNCSDTFLASAEYYGRCEQELQNCILPRIGRIERLLDAGCGNGRFTLLLAKAARIVDAYDVSPPLIQLARNAAKSAHVTNVRFRVRDIAKLAARESAYDVVSCMGVLSTIIDEPAFFRVLDSLRKAVRAGGFVVLRETLSSLPEGQLVESESYAIRYRNEDRYRQTLADRGMTLEYEAPLLQESSLVNRIQLYRVRSPKY